MAAGVCCFCNLKEENESMFGKFHQLDDIVTHYYCLLLSSNMEQNGNDSDGILGFLPEDIYKELKRGKRLVCSYCKHSGATLGCCNTKCKKVFHLPCGRKKGSLHQFFGQYKSFCADHRPNQKISADVLKEVKKSEVTCAICYDNVVPMPYTNTLWAPCCRKNSWFHHECIQKLAISAGYYFFKCPLCNNMQTFQKAMLNFGIYIPEQDASWEMVPNAYQELLHRHDRCDASPCKCPKGRNYDVDGTRWELILCKLCGSSGIHLGCGQLKWSATEWECAECRLMLRKARERDEENDSPGSANSRDTKVRNNAEECGDVMGTHTSRATLSTNEAVEPRFLRRDNPFCQNIIRRENVMCQEEDEITIIEDSDDEIQILDDMPMVKPLPNSNVLFTNDGATIPVVQMNSVSVAGERFNIEGDVNVRVQPQLQPLTHTPTAAWITHPALPHSSATVPPTFEQASTFSLNSVSYVTNGPIQSKRLKIEESSSDAVQYVESVTNESACAVFNEVIVNETHMQRIVMGDNVQILPLMPEQQFVANTIMPEQQFVANTNVTGMEQSLAGSWNGTIQCVPNTHGKQITTNVTKLHHRHCTCKPRTKSNAACNVFSEPKPRRDYNRVISENIKIPINGITARITGADIVQLMIYDEPLWNYKLKTPMSLDNPVLSKARTGQFIKQNQRGLELNHKSSSVDVCSYEMQAEHYGVKVPEIITGTDKCSTDQSNVKSCILNCPPSGGRTSDSDLQLKTSRREKRHHQNRSLPTLSILTNLQDMVCSEQNTLINDTKSISVTKSKCESAASTMMHSSKAFLEINKENTKLDLSVGHLAENCFRFIRTRSLGAPPAYSTRSRNKLRIYTVKDLEIIEKRRAGKRNQCSMLSVNTDQSADKRCEEDQSQTDLDKILEGGDRTPDCGYSTCNSKSIDLSVGTAELPNIQFLEKCETTQTLMKSLSECSNTKGCHLTCTDSNGDKPILNFEMSHESGVKLSNKCMNKVNGMTGNSDAHQQELVSEIHPKSQKEFSIPNRNTETDVDYTSHVACVGEHYTNSENIPGSDTEAIMVKPESVIKVSDSVVGTCLDSSSVDCDKTVGCEVSKLAGPCIIHNPSRFPLQKRPSTSTENLSKRICLEENISVEYVSLTNTITASNCFPIKEIAKIKAVALTARKFRPPSPLEIQQREMLRRLQIV